MKYLLSIGLVVAISFSVTAQVIPNASLLSKSNQITFTENKGQIGDQHHQPVPEVLFSGKTGGLVFHLRTDGISYQQTRIDTWKKEEREVVGNNEEKEVPDQLTIYRTDLRWIAANPAMTIVKGKAKPDQTNYYHAICPDGVTHVRSYESVTYKNIYEGIDLKWYDNGGQLEYDFVVQPGRDYKKIRWEINGARDFSVSETGELVIQTPLGELREAAPVAFQENKKVPVFWDIHDNNISFEIPEYNEALPIIIDPIILGWSSYFGGNLEEFATDCEIDHEGNIFVTGRASSSINIATTGSHQQTFGGGGTDAFLAKFNASGQLQWSTYYGGTGNEIAEFCKTDNQGNVYWGGPTNSNSVMATPGSHQSIFGGGIFDAFLIKCDPNGIRQWATYLGGDEAEYPKQCSIDKDNNIYLSGYTESTSNIATSNGYQTNIGGTYDAFLAKFNSNGLLQWSTYYGLEGDERGSDCVVDNQFNVYLAGTVYTNISTGISLSTPGAHQTTFTGASDAFLIKFDANGQRQWATYYGGPNEEYGESCALDSKDNIYLTGATRSETLISTNDAQQVSLAGGLDIYIVKFDSSGKRVRGTYFGGKFDDVVTKCVSATYDDIYIIGRTSSDSLIGTSGAPQSVYADSADALLISYSSEGMLRWATYFGGSAYDIGNGGAVNNDGTIIYMVGETQSMSQIATSGSHQSTYAGLRDAFIVRYEQPVGIEESNSNHNFLIYPNPTGGDITIDMKESISDINLLVTNTAGQVIHSGIYRGKRLIQLDIQAAPGVYFVRVSDGERIGVRKLVVR